MNCSQCQAPNPQDSAFCSNCGTRLVPATASAPSSGYTTQPGQGASAGYGGPTGYGQGGYEQGGYGQGGPAAPTGQYAPAGQYPPPPGQQPPAGYTPGGGAYQQRSTGPARPFQFDRNRLTQADQIVGVASLITMISIWLPWFSASVGAISATGSGTDVHGWLWLVFVLDLLILGYLVMRAGWEESPVRLPFSHEPLLIAATGLQLLLVLIAFFDMPSFPGVSYGWAWGAFIGLLAAIVAAAPVIVPRVRSFLEGRRASA
jgi:hypothetical protein